MLSARRIGVDAVSLRFGILFYFWGRFKLPLEGSFWKVVKRRTEGCLGGWNRDGGKNSMVIAGINLLDWNFFANERVSDFSEL